MQQLWWYLVRATGIVALGLGVGSLALGFLFSARETGRRRAPAWWLDLHNYLGGLALAFTAVHLVAVYADSLNGLGVVEILVPFTAADQTWGMALGTIAAWLFAAVVITSWPRKRLRPTAWRIVHVSSIVGVVMAGVHGWLTGSEVSTFGFKLLLLVLVALVAYPSSLRLYSLIDKKRRRAHRARAPKSLPRQAA